MSPDGALAAAARSPVSPVTTSDSASAERMIGILEALLAEQRGIAERQRDALANHAAAIAAQHAQSRQALRWFASFILAFGAVAALTHSWHPLVDYFAGG